MLNLDRLVPIGVRTFPLQIQGFETYIPAVIVVPNGSARASPLTGETSSEPRILLIDQQELFLAALASLLSAPTLNARVELTSRSDTGLTIARQGETDLVVCELQTQPLPAQELADLLAQQEPRIPVILLAGSEDDALLMAAVSSSAAGIFYKDSAYEEFLVGVRTVLCGHRAVGAGVMQRVLTRIGNEASLVRTYPGSLLSPTEVQILTLIGEAKSIPTIAAARGISSKTVRNHLASIYRKLDLHGRIEAMLIASRMGLTSD